MDNLTYLKNALRKHSLVFSAIATPLLLMNSAYSGFKMNKELGYSYNQFLFNFVRDWGEMSYFSEDYQRLWKIIRNKIAEDPEYLQKTKKNYEQIFTKYLRIFATNKTKNFSKISAEDMLYELKIAQEAQIDSVGLGHVIEPIGIELENEFKSQLKKEIKCNREKFNQYYTVLTTPTELSFISEEETKLANIGEMPIESQDVALKSHAGNYSWIQNSYGGKQKLSVKFFKKRLKAGIKVHGPEKIRNEKEELISKLNLSDGIRQKIGIIDFSTVWQDQRKANILKSVENFALVLKEISKRLKIDEKSLYYLTPAEVKNLKSIKEIYNIDLGSRIDGLFILQMPDEERFVTGEEYRELIKFRESISKMVIEEELRGSIANSGTAIGRAVIINSYESLKKVKAGDIIVASMTRPEYMMALKKAAAIVTDEGGITCHAAIVSRELGIPCVVGTKIATKSFKDGDTIEVRANHGLVRKLK